MLNNVLISPRNDASPDVSSARAIQATPPKANETAKNFRISGDSRNIRTDKIRVKIPEVVLRIVLEATEVRPRLRLKK